MMLFSRFLLMVFPHAMEHTVQCLSRGYGTLSDALSIIPGYRRFFRVTGFPPLSGIC